MLARLSQRRMGRKSGCRQGMEISYPDTRSEAFSMLLGHKKTDAMKKYLFAALFCLSLCSAYCQISEVERCDDLDLLTVAEKKLLPALNTVLAEERTRN